MQLLDEGVTVTEPVPLDDVNDLLNEQEIEVRNLSTISSDSEDSVFAIHGDKPRKAFRVLNSFILGNPNGAQY